MKNNTRIVYGLVTTSVIFLLAALIGRKLPLNSMYIADTFATHTIMLVLSVTGIYTMREYINYKISLPKFRNVLKPILFGLAVTIVINFSINIIVKLTGGNIEEQASLAKMNPIQVLLTVFIYASIAEEMLFRGFLQNLLNPLKTVYFTLFKRKISLPVLICALAFGAAHLILITTGAGAMFLVRIVLFTTCLGLVAGYYQEKYNNNSFAIIVHMSGNLTAVIAAFILH